MALKICFIGKYPPIQGGVSAQSYWMVRGLAERGHDVSVVTNAFEVEPRFRMVLKPSDYGRLEFDDANGSGGRVRLFTPQPFLPAKMAHIPHSNPFVSKLAGLATDVVRRNGCEVIFAYYYEPYGVAAALAAAWTGRPFLIKHAGSDLDRLFASPDLAVTYTNVLKQAAAVVTQPRLAGRFLSIGIAPQALCRDTAFGLPKEVFHPDSGSTAQRPFTVGMYGKIGWAKGTFDLISAIGRIKAAGREVQLRLMIGTAQAALIKDALADAGLAGEVDILDLVPNWRVPEFIRSCDTVCFLERDFPVAIHGPIVPREVLACGTCLILSGDIARNLVPRLRLETGRELVVVEDPKRIDTLADAILDLMDRPGKAAEIGSSGNRVSQAIEGQVDMPGHWERALTAVAQGSVLPQDLRLLENDLTAQAMALIPELMPALAEAEPGLVHGVKPVTASADPHDIARTFCVEVAASANGDLAPALRALSEVCAARVALLAARPPPAPGWFTHLPEDDQALIDSRIERAPSCAVVEVETDIAGPLCQLTTDGALFRERLLAAPATPAIFMIICGPNKSVQEMRISRDLADLFARIGDGCRVADLIVALGAGDASLTTELLGVIRQLWTRGAIQFAAPEDPTKLRQLPRSRDR
jgi:glycosyltransferase involved in cell wall biosynthesis